MTTHPEVFVQTGPNWWLVFVVPSTVGEGCTPLDAIVDLLDAEAARERELEDKAEQYWASNTGFDFEGKPLSSEGSD